MNLGSEVNFRWKPTSATILEPGTQSLVVCLRCGKVLYQMPTTEITGIYRRVAINTILGHSELLGHKAEILFVDQKTHTEKSLKVRAIIGCRGKIRHEEKN